MRGGGGYRQLEGYPMTVAEAIAIINEELKARKAYPDEFDNDITEAISIILTICQRLQDTFGKGNEEL
jgi:hypothetical protein